MCHDVLIRALHAYVCWRIAAGAVGWVWLLLGLATDRLGATNALVAAMHKIAATARVRGIVIARLRPLAAPAKLCSSLLVSQTASSRPAPSRLFRDPSSGVMFACRNADLGAGASWTLAASSRGRGGQPP